MIQAILNVTAFLLLTATIGFLLFALRTSDIGTTDHEAAVAWSKAKREIVGILVGGGIAFILSAALPH